MEGKNSVTFDHCSMFIDIISPHYQSLFIDITPRFIDTVFIHPILKIIIVQCFLIWTVGTSLDLVCRCEWEPML